MRNFRSLTAAALLLVGTFGSAMPASAATYVLELQASTANISLAEVNSGGLRFRFQTITPLAGYSPLTFVLGDVIQAHIRLDAPLTVASGTAYNAMDFFLGDTTGAAGPTGTSGTTTLFLGGNPFAVQNSGTTSFAFLFNSYTSFSGTAFSFDEVQSDFTITELGSDSITPDFIGLRGITVDQVAAVPEPATWAMLIAGFGLVGAALRRPRRALNLA